MIIYLISAKHVLDGISGDSLLIHLRVFQSDTFAIFPYWLKIRNKGTNLYKTHPTEDVAVMDLRTIQRTIDRPFLGPQFLATEEMLKDAEISPGTELSILGYPFGIGYNEEFPILRGGKIASYPLVPVERYKTFLLDFEVFGGTVEVSLIIVKWVGILTKKLNRFHQLITTIFSVLLFKKEG